MTIILENYPTLPPRIVFNTPIFHPSIELGEDNELKIHWAHGVARFNHKLSLIAICEIVCSKIWHGSAAFRAGTPECQKSWWGQTYRKVIAYEGDF